MNSDEKILKQLEALQAGQKALQADVTAVKGEVEKIPAIEKQLAQVSGEVSKIPAIEKQLDQHGKLLTGGCGSYGNVPNGATSATYRYSLSPYRSTCGQR